MEKKTLSKGVKMTILVAAAVLLFAILALGAYFFFITGMPFGKIIENVSVAGVDLSGMTYEEAMSAVENSVCKTYGTTPMKVTIMDQTLTLSPTITSPLDVKAAVRDAYAYGRTGLPEKRRRETQTALAEGVCLDVSNYVTIHQEQIHSQVEAFAKNFESDLVQSQWTVDGPAPDLTQDAPKAQTLVITMGSAGRKLDCNSLEKAISEAFRLNQFELNFDCSVSEPDPLDLKAIQKKIRVDPVDAEMDPKTFEVLPHKNGCGFDLKAAKAAISQAKPGEEIRIPIKIIPAKVKKPDLEALLFRDVLATHTATAGSLPGRNINLKLSCEAINGTVLMPGQVFSYNDALGERTPERGWQQAAGYVGNKTVNTYGGGICQASSCLYYVAMQADMEIVTRVNHGFISSYMPFGMDATVSWGGPHFRFKNNSQYPIRIEASASGGSVTVSLIGTDTKDYYVKMEYEVLKQEDYSVVEIEMPPDNPEGYRDGQVITTPYTGYTISTYRCKYSKDTDALISREHEATSYYSKRDKEICRIVSPEAEDDTLPQETMPAETVPEETAPEETVPEETVLQEAVPEENVSDQTISQTEPQENLPIQPDE